MHALQGRHSAMPALLLASFVDRLPANVDLSAYNPPSASMSLL